MDELTRRFVTLVERCRYAVFATADSAGPWAATINFVAISPANWLFYSSPTARHSLAIAADGRVGGALFATDVPDMGVDGAQFEAQVRVLPDDEVDSAHETYYVKNFPDPAEREGWLIPAQEFVGDAVHKFYAVSIERAWVIDVANWGADKVDRRAEVPLQQLRHGD